MKRVSFIFGGYAYTKQQDWDVEKVKTRK